MTVKACIIRVDGTVTVDESFDVTLPNLQAVVGGCIEAVTLAEDPECHFYLNEEGKILEPPLARNGVATGLVRLGEFQLMPGDFIAGDVILTGMSNGEERDCPQKWISHAFAMAQAQAQVSGE